MAFGFNDTQNRYDRLINLVIEELKRILSDLLTDKETHKRLRNTIAHKLHAEKTEYIANKRGELETKSKENSYTISKVQLEQITHWQEELAQLIIDEINIERRQAITIKDDPARIDEEIKVIGSIIKEIKDKAGSKGKRKKLTRADADDIHSRLVNIYQSVLTRQEEANLTATHFEPLKQKIEAKEKQIINLINQLLSAIPGQGPSSAGPSGMGPSGTGPSGAGPSGPSAVLTTGVTEEEAKAIEDEVQEAEKVVKKQRNYFLRGWGYLEGLRKVIESNLDASEKLTKARSFLTKLRRFESREQFRASVSKLTGKLKGIMKRSSISPNVKKRIGNLLQQLKVWEADWVARTAKGLGEKLKRGKKPEEVDWKAVEEDVAKVEKDTQAATAVDESIGKELGQIGKGAEVGEVKAKRRKRARDTAKHGSPGGFMARGREPDRTIPRNIRMKPTSKRGGFQGRPGYNRAAAKRATRREIKEEGY